MSESAKKEATTKAVVPVSSPGLTAVVNDRLTGRYELDVFGFDRELAGLAAPLASLRWSVAVDGIDLVPKGPALVVFSQRLGLSEPWIVTSAFRDLGRELRPVGLPDRQPMSSLLATAGWVPANAADVRAVLRSGSLVGVGLTRSPRRRFRPGKLDVDIMQAAIDLGVPVVPLAVVGRELGRRWQAIIGAPVSTRRRSTLTAAELADRTRERVSQLLEVARPHHLPI